MNDYREYKPGLQRRLAYGYYIRTNNTLASTRAQNITNLDESYIDDVTYEFSYSELIGDIEIPNGDLSELTNDLVNLVIQNQQRDSQYNHFGTESIHDLDSTVDIEVDHENDNSGSSILERFNNREHFTFNNLIDIEKGLISLNLVEKSKVIYFGRNDKFKAEVGVQDVFISQFCSICRENFEYIDITRQLICKHIFHINCIDTWFTKNKTCPECRYEI